MASISPATAAAAASAQGLSIPVDPKKTLKLKGQEYEELHGLGELGASLRKLDVSNNALQRLPQDVLPPKLTFLNASHNKLTGVALSSSDIGGCPELVVCNAAHCRISSLPSTSLQACRVLKALVLNNNSISDGLLHLGHLTTLNTLVLSHNRIPKVPKVLLQRLPGLVKLSLSHNRLDAFPKVWLCPDLVELRLAGNAIADIPSKVARLTNLRLLDCSNNAIASFDSIAHLSTCPRLAHVSMRGNPVAGPEAAAAADAPTTSARYASQMRTLLPHLAVLDGLRLVGNARGKRGQAAPGAAVALKRRRQGLDVDASLLQRREAKAARVDNAPSPPATRMPEPQSKPGLAAQPGSEAAPEPVPEPEARTQAPRMKLSSVEVAPGDLPSVSGAVGVEEVSARRRAKAAKKAAKHAKRKSKAAPPAVVADGTTSLGAAAW